VCLFWGTTYFAIRVALETIPPALLGGLRYTAAGIMLAAILAARRERIPHWSQWLGLAMVGLLTIGIGNGGVIWAEQWVPSGVAAVTVASVPFWMIGVDVFGRNTHGISAGLVCGLLIGFAGIVLLVWPDLKIGSAADQHFLVGIVVLQVACIGWALGSALARRRAHGENVLAAAAVQMALGGVFMLIAGTVRGEWSRLAFTQRTVAAEIYLTLVGSIVGYSAYTYALKHLPTATVSLYAYVNPVIAMALGTLFLGEPFGPRVIASAAMVLAGSALVQWRGGAPSATHSSPRQDVTDRSHLLRPSHMKLESSQPTSDASNPDAALGRTAHTTVRPLTSRTRNSTTAITSRTQMKLPSV